MSNHRKIILLVEDNPDDIALTCRALEHNHFASEVVVVHDGAEALDYLFAAGAYAGRDARVMPQVVLLDLQLPKVDDVEVLSHIRRDERTKLIPVVILSLSNEEKDIAQCYRLGANSYIRKPVDFVQFTEAMRQFGRYWLFLNEEPPTVRLEDNQMGVVKRTSN
jgi:CheY-like chemotaxis protein